MPIVIDSQHEQYECGFQSPCAGGSPWRSPGEPDIPIHEPDMSRVGIDLLATLQTIEANLPHGAVITANDFSEVVVIVPCKHCMVPGSFLLTNTMINFD